MCFYKCRLALYGSVSVRELSANLNTCSVRVKLVADQTCGALLSSRSGRFCLDRLVLWQRQASGFTSSTLDLARSHTCFDVAPGSSCMAATMTWYGLKADLAWVATFLVSWVTITLTSGSQEWVYTAALATCSFLYRVTKDGSSRSPFSLGRKRHPVSANLARPLHLFKNLGAMGCSVDSSHTGKWLTERSHVRRGHMASLKSSSFCWAESRVLKHTQLWHKIAPGPVVCSMDTYRCSQEGKCGVSNEGDGLSIELESWVIGPANASLDCQAHTCRHIGLHAWPWQPGFSGGEEGLTGG